MSVRLSHDVFCDSCGSWITVFVSHKKEVIRARKTVAEDGWVVKVQSGRRVDLCPGCANEIAPRPISVDLSNGKLVTMGTPEWDNMVSKLPNAAT